MNHVTKKFALNLVKKWALKIQEILKISKPIYIIIESSKNINTLKSKFKLDKEDWNCKGVFLKKKNKRKIFIFYNRHTSKKDLFGTLIHEYLHALMDYELTNSHISSKKEEKIIRKLEKLFLRFSREVWLDERL